MAQTTLKIRDHRAELLGPSWWQKFCRSVATSGGRNIHYADLRYVLLSKYRLQLTQLDPIIDDSFAKSVEGDEKDITLFLLKWS